MSTLKSKPKTIFKYANRETGHPIYFSKTGNDFFKNSSRYGLFKFVGMVSREEQEQEENEALDKANTEVEEKEEEALKPGKKVAKVKELSAEEKDQVLGKKTKVGKKDEDDLDLEAGSQDA